MKKILNGQFFTKKDLWLFPHVMEFIKKYDPKVIIDPFAGNGDLLRIFADKFAIRGFDIDPSLGWPVRNSLAKIRKSKSGFLVTNPPYLSKVSSSRKKIFHSAFTDNKFEDLYLIALQKMLDSKMPGVAILPETFINSSFDMKNVFSITILIPNPFEDTEVPVCIVCFDPNQIFDDVLIYKNSIKIGNLNQIRTNVNKIFIKNKNHQVRFNDGEGKLALIAYDGMNGESIRFLLSKELKYKREIKHSSRVVTKISISQTVTNKMVEQLNFLLSKYRSVSNDILLSPFKGNVKNGNSRRRRLDYTTARKIISEVLSY